VDIGYIDSEKCWVSAEHDAQDNIVGFNRRFRDGSKKAVAGSQRGLTVQSNWNLSPLPLLLVEGLTDVLACSALDISCVGRPWTLGAVDLLGEMLADVPTERVIIVVGERDRKPNGDWPGRYGAMRTAEQLSEKLGRPILWSLPPSGYKDVRAWFIGNVSDS